MSTKQNKIHCITLNPAIDEIIHLHQLSIGLVCEAVRDVEYPAGKGFNVARALRSLKATTYAYGAVDEFRLTAFHNEFPKHRETILKSKVKTRKNISLIQKTDGEVTHIRMVGGNFNPDEFEKLCNCVLKRVSQGDLVSICGSLMQGTDITLLSSFFQKLRLLDAKIIFDFNGSNLRALESTECYLIKPNIQELEEYLGVRIENPLQIPSAVSKTNLNFELMIVTLGSKGAILFHKNSNTLFKASYLSPFDQTNKYSVGAGDAFLAGVLHQLSCGASLQDVLKEGLVCGYSSLYNEIPGVLDVTKHAKIRQLIDIQAIRT